MHRVVILGRGGGGKSTAASRLGALTGIPVIELDKHFWRPGLTPTAHAEWELLHHEFVAGKQWIIEGDLGPHDALGIRLSAADTVLVLDFSLARCAWQAVRRSRERADFWWWLLLWRRRSRPTVLRAIATFASHADVQIFRNPAALNRFMRS